MTGVLHFTHSFILCECFVCVCGLGLCVSVGKCVPRFILRYMYEAGALILSVLALMVK